MAGITYVGTTWTTTAGNKTVGTFTPAVGDLLVVFAANSGRTTAQLPTITVDVQGITFSRHANSNIVRGGGVDAGSWYVSDSFCTVASACTVTMTQSGDTGGGLAVWRLGGMFRVTGGQAGVGNNAIRQFKAAEDIAAATPSITMTSALLTTNPTLGVVWTATNGSANSAPPTGWTENNDSGYNTPPSGLEVISRASGSTLTTITWTAATPSTFSACIIELDASDPGGGVDVYPSHAQWGSQQTQRLAG